MTFFQIRNLARIALLALVILEIPVNSFAQSNTNSAKAPATIPADGQHDFDFEFGAWRAHLKRLLNPLSGPGVTRSWVELDGLSTVRKVWGGRANLGEFDVANASSRIEGLSLRTYNPATHLWSIHWASARDGVVTSPMIGRFSNGRGEFQAKDDFNGKPIIARFIFSDISATSFKLEQAFSADDGKTWEANWIATFTKVPS